MVHTLQCNLKSFCYIEKCFGNFNERRVKVKNGYLCSNVFNCNNSSILIKKKKIRKNKNYRLTNRYSKK